MTHTNAYMTRTRHVHVTHVMFVIPMEYVWDIWDMSVYGRDVYGTCMVFVRFVYGMCMVHVRDLNMYGIPQYAIHILRNGIVGTVSHCS